MKALRPWLLPAIGLLCGGLGLVSLVALPGQHSFWSVMVGVNFGFAFADAVNIVKRRLETKSAAYRLIAEECRRVIAELDAQRQAENFETARDPFALDEVPRG